MKSLTSRKSVFSTGTSQPLVGARSSLNCYENSLGVGGNWHLVPSRRNILNVLLQRICIAHDSPHLDACSSNSMKLHESQVGLYLRLSL